MAAIQEFLRRLRYFFRRDKFERELEEEMRHHLAMKAENNPGGASFGNLTLLKEDSRAMWNWNFASQIGQDVRYAIRTMRTNRLFTLTAALSLALGIGANTAIYSFMDAIMMRALPVQHPEELVIFHWHSKTRPGVVHSINGSARREGKTGTTSPDFPFAALELFANDHDTVASIFAYTYGQRFNLVVNNHADSADGVPVSGDFYRTLGVAPAAGRLIGPSDDRAGAPLVAVLSYDYWSRRFAKDPDIVGRTILGDNHPMTIVGVSPQGFFGIDPSTHPDLFFPIHTLPLFAQDSAKAEQSRFFDPYYYSVEMTARLRPGITLEQAQARFSAQFRQFAESVASSEKDRQEYPQVWLEPGSSGLESLRRQYSQPLRVLMTMVGIILLIACSNMANLLLARAAARRREMAVRLSLGAGRWRVMRQLLTESVMLSLLGGAIGVLFAYWGIQGITWLLANGRERFPLHADLSWPVLGFTLALSLATGLLFGLAPALQATKLDLTPALKASKAGATGAPRRWIGRVSATRALVPLQIAMSLLLVIGATLFVRNLANLNSIDLGFNRDKLLVFFLDPGQAGYKGGAAEEFLTGVAGRIRELPGVRSVGMSSFPLVSYYSNGDVVVIPGAPPGSANKSVDLLNIDAGFLSTMQIPVMLGRELNEHDMASATSVVVNQKFASTFFESGNPLGRHFSLEHQPGDFEIAGVVRNAHYNSIQEETGAIVYIPFTRDLAALRRMYFEVRTAGDPAGAINSIREIVRQANPTVLMTSINTQARIIDQTIGQQRTFADLGTCFAILALLIACVGLYGAMAFGVARRTSEIGIRMALGARRGGILWMVMREVLVLAAAGLAIGYYAARQLAHWIESFLFGMKPTDTTSIAVAIAILFAAALVAGFAPAWRAARIHPMTALREE